MDIFLSLEKQSNGGRDYQAPGFSPRGDVSPLSRPGRRRDSKLQASLRPENTAADTEQSQRASGACDEAWQIQRSASVSVSISPDSDLEGPDMTPGEPPHEHDSIYRLKVPAGSHELTVWWRRRVWLWKIWDEQLNLSYQYRPCLHAHHSPIKVFILNKKKK